MRSFLFLVWCSLFFYGCGPEEHSSQKGEKEEGPPKAFIGRWLLTDISAALKNERSPYVGFPEEFFNGIAFDIREDRIIFQRGYYKSPRKGHFKEKQGAPFIPSPHKDYLGYSADLEFRGDSIFIRFPEEEGQRFFFRIDTLEQEHVVLSRKDSLWRKFEKIPIPDRKGPSFDRIVFSRTACYGTCPVLDISLNRNGEFKFQGRKYTDTTGYFQGRLSEDQVDHIFERFERAQIDQLRENYHASVTDLSTISVCFIKDGRIIKSIHDYGSKAPRELLWAYHPISHAYQKTELDPASHDRQIPPLYEAAFFKEQEGKDQFLELERSETFFLRNELDRAMRTEEAFEKEYLLAPHSIVRKFKVDTSQTGRSKWKTITNYSFAFSSSKVDRIATDGRYYRFYYEDRDPRTLDLGYNFLEQELVEEDFEEI